MTDDGKVHEDPDRASIDSLECSVRAHSEVPSSQQSSPSSSEPSGVTSKEDHKSSLQANSQTKLINSNDASIHVSKEMDPVTTLDDANVTHRTSPDSDNDDSGTQSINSAHIETLWSLEDQSHIVRDRAWLTRLCTCQMCDRRQLQLDDNGNGDVCSHQEPSSMIGLTSLPKLIEQQHLPWSSHTDIKPTVNWLIRFKTRVSDRIGLLKQKL